MESIWSRSKDVPYPKTWFEFTEKEAKNSDRQIKYWIQDLPEDRFDDAVQHIADHFTISAPISSFFGAASNKTYVNDYIRPCRLRFDQKMSLVCFREGSDEIVGLSINYVATKNDPFWEEITKATQTNEYREHMMISKLMYANLDLFEKYGVDKYLYCMVLSVSPAYRGLNIGQRLIESWEPLCKAVDVHLSQTFFSSDYSNHIADKMGFTLEVLFTMDELYKIYPKIPFQKIQSKQFTVKSWNFEHSNKQSAIEKMESIWLRPSNVPYPKVWLEFTAKESKNSDRQIKYWVQDLPEDRFDDAIQHLNTVFLHNAPLSKFFGAANNKLYAEDYLRPCRWRLPQKVSLVCFREGSDEIVGLSINCVAVKNDPFWQEVNKATQSKEYRDHLMISTLVNTNFDYFEKSGVDKYFYCMCLSVAPAYRGLNICQRLIESWRPLCKSIDIHTTSSRYSSDSANYITDKMGFTTEVQYTMDELYKMYPKIPFHQIDSKLFTIKSWNFGTSTK